MAERSVTRDEINLTAIFDLVREIGEGAKTYREVLDEAKSAVSRAEERLRLVLAIGDACEATKTRKPRKDKGVKRAKPAPESTTPGGSEIGNGT